VLYQNDLQRAQELRAESIRIARIQGDPWCLMPALIGTAQLSIVEGDLDTAHTNLTEVVELLHRTGDNWSMSWTITDLAYVALLRNNLSEAGDCIVECLALAKSYGNLRASIIALIQAAELISLIAEDPGKSDYLLAAQLCGATAPISIRRVSSCGSIRKSSTTTAWLKQNHSSPQRCGKRGLPLVKIYPLMKQSP
jgi:hypothetical protein